MTILNGFRSRGLYALARAVAEAHGVTMTEMVSRARYQNAVQARHYLMSELRTKGYSYPYIGLIMGGIDHTTVIAACNKVDRQRLAVCGAPAEPVEPLWQRALRARSA
jgi:chromosomal replication initiation ATPase DnaA